MPGRLVQAGAGQAMGESVPPEGIGVLSALAWWAGQGAGV